MPYFNMLEKRAYKGKRKRRSTVVAKMEYAAIRALMDAEDPRIARALEAKVLLGDPVTKIAGDLGVSEPWVYQLIKRAKEIGKKYRMNE